MYLHTEHNSNVIIGVSVLGHIYKKAAEREYYHDHQYSVQHIGLSSQWPRNTHQNTI